MTIQVINRAFDILELVAKDPETPKTLSEIAGELQLNAGTCSNIIKTMLERKYLDKLDKPKGYCLGAKVYDLSGSEGYKKDLIKAAKDELELLTTKLNENSLLSILNGDLRIAILRSHSNNALQATTPTEKPAYETTSGRLLVAMLSEKELEKYTAKYGLPKGEDWPEAKDLELFQKQIKKIQKEQFAAEITKGEIVGLAAPVYRKEKVIASLGIYMPVNRYNQRNKAEIIDRIKKAANKISKKLS
jgi:DNA-binding IclR family transcriptional regulator